MAPHRRHRARDLEESRSGEGENISKPHFVIPLKPLVSAELADASLLSKVVESEYNTRLLESMGAAPTKANLEMIKKYVPIDKSCLKVSARKKGHMMDEVDVCPPTLKYDYKVPHMGCRAKPHEMVTLGIMQARMNEDVGANVDQCFGTLEGGAVEELDPEAGGEKLSEFSKKSRQFLFPYNLEKKAPSTVKELLQSLNTQRPSKGLPRVAKPLRASRRDVRNLPSPSPPPSRPRTPPAPPTSGDAPRASPTSPTPCSSSPSAAKPAPRGKSNTPKSPLGGTRSKSSIRSAGTGLTASRLNNSKSSNAARVEGISEKNAASETQRDELAQELEKERLQELSLTSHMVESAQERFCRSLLEWKSKEISEEALQSRVSEEDFIESIRELGSPVTVGLLRNTLQLLYNTHFRHMNDEDPAQEKLVFQIHQDFTTMIKTYRKRKSHLFFTMPVTLLSLRSLIETVFSGAFPLWEGTYEGKEAMRKMDRTVIEMLDPHSYYSDLSLFQSTPAAIHILQGEHKQARKTVQQRFYCTSPLNRAALGTPASGSARRLLGLDTRAKTRLAGGYGKSGTSIVNLDPSGKDKTNVILSAPHRRHLCKLNMDLHKSQQPYQGGDFASTVDRGGWLGKETHSGCKGI